ncbi:AAA family ATPase [Saccharothrix variisporea]|uniref:AAA family ATPase n=1 Tax=Saccharothrix variisporea TaxID=543527 RepID=UPI001FE361F7|nr:AAA family ATPase [Saccharothrix variisporea]
MFVSSTFGDLEDERTALHERVFPRLRALCASRGGEFHAIDLRWGVSDDAAADRRITEICLSEVDRCRRTTERPNFLLVLGDRYGTTMMPPIIDAEIFRAVREEITDDTARRVVDRWYWEDRNSVPPVFVLQSKRGPLGGQAWDSDKDLLRSTLLQAAENCKDSSLLQLLRTSLTEQEAARGIPAAGPELPDAVHVFRRVLDGLPHDGSAGRYRDLIDVESTGGTEKRVDPRAVASLQRFHDGVAERLRLGGQTVTEYRATWDPSWGRPRKDHVEPWCDRVYTALAAAIDAELRAASQLDSHQSEELAHRAFGSERRTGFTGRGRELDAITAHIRSGVTRPLVLVGEPGIGKTALLSEAAHRIADTRPVIARFIGATPRSADLRTFVGDLCRALPAVEGHSHADQRSATDMSALAAAFREGLAAVPPDAGLVLVLDALDQFTGTPDLSWLPTDLPPGVHMVLSAQRGSAAERAAVDLGAVMEPVGALPSAEGDELLSRWLDGAGRPWLGEARRTLTPQQRSEVLESFASHGNPLHLRMAFEEARCWASYTHVPQGTLATDVPGILQQLLDRLEAEHGPALVREALALLAASRYGLSESELLDLLSASTEVTIEVPRRMPYSPPLEVRGGGATPVKRLPPILWARLHADLEPYLNERTSEGRVLLGFYHRQLTEAVTARYLAGHEAGAAHRRLADYFAAQPLDLTDGGQSAANTRKLLELPYHLAHSGSWDDLGAILTDFHFLQRKVEAVGIEERIDQDGRVVVTHTGVYALQDDFELALRLWPEDRE